MHRRAVQPGSTLFTAQRVLLRALRRATAERYVPRPRPARVYGSGVLGGSSVPRRWPDLRARLSAADPARPLLRSENEAVQRSAVRPPPALRGRRSDLHGAVPDGNA